MPNGNIQYTRDGSFNVSPEGNLETKMGFKVFPGIQVPPGAISVTISGNGQVEAYSNGNPEPQTIGKISLFKFINPAGLKNSGRNLYSLTQASGESLQLDPGKNGVGNIQQGALESSNVNVMREMTNLIKAQRAYEMNAKVMTVADQMLQTINNVR